MFHHKKILIVTPERLGDTLFYTPSIHFLKQQFPSCEIDLIALSPLSASVFEHNPAIHQIYIAPSQEETIRMQAYYDVGINIHNNQKAREYFEWLAIEPLTELPANPAKHQCEQSVEFFESFLHQTFPESERRYRLYPQHSHEIAIKRLLNDANVDLKKACLIGLHLGCHGIAKKKSLFSFLTSYRHKKVWALSRFVKLAKILKKQNPHIQFVITGSKSEAVLAEKFCKKVPGSVNVADKTSVLDLAALMPFLKVFVTSDTGLLHVACATNVAVVALFGPTSVTRTRPYPMQSNYRILQKETMADLSVKEVAQAVTSLLNRYCASSASASK